MNIDKKLAIILALFAILLLILGYLSMQGGQVNPAQIVVAPSPSHVPQNTPVIAKPNQTSGKNTTPAIPPALPINGALDANKTGGGTGKITNNVPAVVQVPPKNATNDTIIPPPPPPPPPPIASGIIESDFMVTDDSMPKLLTSQKPFELPPPPEAKAQ